MGSFEGTGGAVVDLGPKDPEDTIEFDWADLSKPSQYEEMLFRDWRGSTYPGAIDGALVFSLADLFRAFQAGARSVLGLLP
jgi:hypothetical protein